MAEFFAEFVRHGIGSKPIKDKFGVVVAHENVLHIKLEIVGDVTSLYDLLSDFVGKEAVVNLTLHQPKLPAA